MIGFLRRAYSCPRTTSSLVPTLGGAARQDALGLQLGDVLLVATRIVDVDRDHSPYERQVPIRTFIH